MWAGRAVNAELASYETIKRFYLYEGHLSVEAGQLTPSLKLRRGSVWEDFGDRLEALYAGKPPRPVGRAQVAL